MKIIRKIQPKNMESLVEKSEAVKVIGTSFGNEEEVDMATDFCFEEERE